MEQLNECLFLTLVFCYNYRLNYFGSGSASSTIKDILTDLIYVILFSISRINSYYSRSTSVMGRIYQSIWYTIQVLIDVFFIIAHMLGWWKVSFMNSVITRIILTIALWTVQFNASKLPSRTTWTFFFVCCLHGILTSDLIRMSCFFCMHQPMRQLLPLFLFLLFSTLNLGLMLERRSKGSVRTLASRVTFIVLLSLLFIVCVWRLFLYRYEYAGEHFLTTKDHILALQILKRIDPYLEINQFLDLFPTAWKSNIDRFSNGGALLSRLHPIFVLFSFVYPLEMDFEAIRRWPGLSKKKYPTFDELSIFTIQPFSRYSGSKVNKRLFKDTAMNTANSYYRWIIWELWIMLGIGLLTNFYGIIRALFVKAVVRPGIRASHYCWKHTSKQGIRLYEACKEQIRKRGWFNLSNKTKTE